MVTDFFILRILTFVMELDFWKSVVLYIHHEKLPSKVFSADLSVACQY